LREFRSGLTPEQWKMWLKFARNEKKKLASTESHEGTKPLPSLQPSISEKPVSSESGSRRPSLRKESPLQESHVLEGAVPLASMLQKEELKEYIRRESLKNVSSEQPSASLLSVPSIPTEELKSYIRRESLKPMAPAPPMESVPPRRASIGGGYVNRQPVTDPIQLLGGRGEEHEEYKASEAALAHRFHANQIRKRSMLIPSSSHDLNNNNNNFDIRDRFVPDSSMIQGHPDNLPVTTLDTVDQDYDEPAEIMEREPEEEYEHHQHQNRYPDFSGPSTFESIQRETEEQQREEEQEVEEEKYEEQGKRLMNPVHTPFHKDTFPEVVEEQEEDHNYPYHQQEQKYQTNYNDYQQEYHEEQEAPQQQYYDNYHHDQEEAYEDHQQHYDQTSFMPKAHSRRFSNFGGPVSHQQTAASSSSSFQPSASKNNSSNSVRPDSSRKPRIVPHLDSGVSLEKKSLGSSTSSAGGSFHGHQHHHHNTHQYHNRSADDRHHQSFVHQHPPPSSTQISAVLAEEQERLRNKNLKLHSSQNHDQQQFTESSTNYYHQQQPSNQQRLATPLSGQSSHRNSPFPAGQQQEMEEEMKGRYYHQHGGPKEREGDLIVMSKADLELMKAQIIEQLTGSESASKSSNKKKGNKQIEAVPKEIVLKNRTTVPQQEVQEGDEVDDDYSELDSIHPHENEGSYPIQISTPTAAVKEVPKATKFKQEEKKKQPVQTQQQQQQPPRAKKGSVLQSLFTAEPFEDDQNSTENKIQTNRPFASSYSLLTGLGPEEDTDEQGPIYSSDEEKRKKKSNSIYPQENAFNSVFTRSMEEREYEVQKKEIKETLQASSVMKNDELNTTSAKKKPNRRESKYNHDTNNYWSSFDAEDIITRIHSIDRTLASLDAGGNNNNNITTTAEIENKKEKLQKEIVPRRQSLLSSNNFDPSTNSYNIGVYPDEQPVQPQQQQYQQSPQARFQPGMSAFNQPQSSPLDHPSSSYAPKPYETPFSPNNTNSNGILPIYPNHIENPYSTLSQAIKQENALNAITNRFQDSVNQRQYQMLFDKHRMESTGTITRLCLVEGPLVRSFEEYPLRVDLESCSVDVVWREPKNMQNLTMQLKKSGGKLTRKPTSSMSMMNEDSNEFLKRSLTSPIGGKDIPPLPSTVQKKKKLETYYQDLMLNVQQNNFHSRILRRERFLFDYIYTGNQAFLRLKDYLKYRIRYSLTNFINQVIMCTSCAEVNTANEMDLEPPVALALGTGGGTGLCSAILNEIFNFLHKSKKGWIPKTPNSSTSSTSFSSSKRGGGGNTYAPSYVSTQVVQEHEENRITMSMALIKGKIIMDLLNPSSATLSNQARKPRIVAKNGRMHLANVTQVDLLNVLDFERIIGLLLGRRVGLYEALKNMEKSVVAKIPFQIPKTNKEKKQAHALNAFATWNPHNNRNTSGGLGGNTTTYPQQQSSAHNSPNRSGNYEVNFHQPVEEHNFLSNNDEDDDEGTEVIDDDGDVITHEKDAILQEHTPSLLISFNVSYGSILQKKRNNVTFRLICPCGDTWFQPGTEHIELSFSFVTFSLIVLLFVQVMI
jgi:hypothetical protein